jgi:eukaryotic-like serine/threonine-protein kinase
MQNRLAFPIAILILSILACALPFNNPMPPTPAATNTPAASNTPVATNTPAATATPTATATPAIPAGSTENSPVDGMVQVYVPGGSFVMGSDTGRSEEQPAHTVMLSAYWIYQTEVTNAMYALCVEAGQCEAPYHSDSKTHRIYYGNATYDNHPVIWIDWAKSNAYCAWAGRRLPTEAEWEYAARGDDERTYPWGDALPTCSLTNQRGCTGDTAAVGSYPDGASPFGVLDMAGNVAEWVSDWYGSYPSGTVVDPQGPMSGEEYIMRGGSFILIVENLQATYRRGSFGITGYAYYDSGFRCARNASQ